MMMLSRFSSRSVEPDHKEPKVPDTPPTIADSSSSSMESQFHHDVQKEAFNLLALRRAAAVAASSSSSMINNDPYLPIDKFVCLSRQRIELENCIGAAEEAFIDKMVLEMHQDELVQSIFDLLDLDGSGTVDVMELAEGIRKMNDLNAIAEVLPLAEKAISTYSSSKTDSSGDGNNQLGVEDLNNFLVRLCETMGCTLLELAQLIVAKVAFNETGRSLLEEAVTSLTSNSNSNSNNNNNNNNNNTEEQSMEQFNDAVVEARLILVFDILDDEHMGLVSLKEVVKHLFRFTKDNMNKEQRQVLLMVNDQKEIDFAEFSELILNVVASFDEHVQFHEIADAMTLSACRQDVTDDDIRELFLNPELYRHALFVDDDDDNDGNGHDDRDGGGEDDEKGEEEKVCEAELAYGKLNRLFDLWDLDHNGTLDVQEFASGLRKFQQVQGISTTMDSTRDALASCDKDNDNKLNRREFALLLKRLAKSSGVDLHRLVDFMVVQSALKDVSSKETAYLKSIKLLNAEDRNAKRSSSHRGSFAGLIQRATSSTTRDDDEEEA